ncbi:MAG: SGNH/GDSL hydrolase family protein [Mycobacteriales bacterium]
MTTIWALGDSLTYGVSWPADTPGGWRSRVADALPSLEWLGSSTENPAPGQGGARHDGHPGWRVDEIATLVTGGPRADIVVVQGGSNDVIQRWAPGRPFHQRYDEFDDEERAAFATDTLRRYESLLSAVAATGSLVVTWTVPPIGPGGALYGSPSVADLNAGIPAIAARHGAVLADMNTALAPDGRVTPGNLGADGVHPTPNGYVVMAGVLTPILRTAIRARSAAR